MEHIKLETFPQGQKFLQAQELQSKIHVVIRGNAMVRIPFDNMKLKMTYGQYLQQVDEADPTNILVDNNKEKKDLIKLKELMKQRNTLTICKGSSGAMRSENESFRRNGTIKIQKNSTIHNVQDFHGDVVT